MPYIDSHCHLDFSVLYDQLDVIFTQAQKNGVSQFIVPSVSADNIEKVRLLAQRYQYVHPAFGLHPCFMDKHSLADLIYLAEKLDTYQPVALGEIGLDFFIATTKEQQSQQIYLFEQQLQLAQDRGLAVILHVRKAHDQVLLSLKKSGFSRGGSVHAFNGSLEQAHRYIKAFGFKLGFGGTLTYEGSKKIRKLAAQLPLSSILLETDAPDMALSGMKEDYNQPSNIKTIAEYLYQLREEPAELIEQQVYLNTCQCFKLNSN
ncbi:TatD family hydrolase [Gammaproteobacteria bacterium AS21]